MQLLQHRNQSIVDNLNNVKREATRHIRNKRKEYLKAKIDELETNGKFKNIKDLYRGISDFKKGCLPRTDVVKDEKVIWLQTATEFWLCGGIVSLSC